MKTSSKIALGLAAVAAFLFAKKKGGISGIGGANDHLLPTVSEYSRYLDIAQNKFGISREQARKRYGQYTIGQWNKLLGIGGTNLQEIDLRDLVLLCNEIADRLQTNVKQVDYPQYRFSEILFYTDPFGGTYVCLHYDYNTGEIVNWYGEDYATLIHTKEQLEKLVERELYRELKGRYGESFADKHFEFLRKNNRIGKVEHSDYDGARVISKDGRHAISFDIFGHGENGITVTSEMKGGGERYGFGWEFLSHIGDYKTLSGAIKAAKKYWDRAGVEYNERDFNKI